MWKSPPEELSISSGMVHLWSVDLSAPPAPISFYASLLSSDEQQRADRFYFQKHKDQFIVGRGLLRELIGKYAKVNPRNITFSYNQFGKPGFEQQAELKFNLSHSNGLAIIGFTIQMEIGLDLEKIDPAINVRQIARHFFAANEQKQIQELPADQQAAAFFKCWTSKEAFIKAHGQGLSLPLDQFEVEVIPDQPAAIKAVHWDLKPANTWDILGFVPRESFLAALVCDQKIEKVSFFAL